MRQAATVAMVVLLGIWMCRAADPAVTNVRAAQRPGTGLVDITYDLADADTATLFVSLSVSTNGGATFFSPAAGGSGDVGHVARGNGKAILWNAKSELPEKLFANMRAMVTADDDWAPPPPAGMVRIPGGTNSGTDPDFGAYSLTVETFYMDATEVSKAKWDDVYSWAISNGYSFDKAGLGKAANHPVHTVNWYDAAKWCNARSQKEGRTPCYTVSGSVYRTGSFGWDGSSVVACNFAANGYRLPSNAEWEYAARGGLSGKRFPWGDRIDHTRANYDSEWIAGVPYNYDDGYQGFDTRYATGDYPYTSPVGAFEANGYGLYDMAGNVWEWGNDLGYSSSRAQRGGDWLNSPAHSRCGRSSTAEPHIAYYGYGFRAVCR